MNHRRRPAARGAYFIEIVSDHRYMKAIDRPTRAHRWHTNFGLATWYETLDEAEADMRWYLGDLFGEVNKKRVHVVRRSV